MNETKVIKCTKCQELTWDDDFHKLNDKPYCSICIKEVLLEQVKKQKEAIDKAIDFIKNGDLLYLATKNSIIYKNSIEIRAVADRLNDLLQILEDKEVSE